MAERMRSRDSRTAASGSPTMRNIAAPLSVAAGVMSTSASMGYASTPHSAAVLTEKCTRSPPPRFKCAPHDRGEAAGGCVPRYSERRWTVRSALADPEPGLLDDLLATTRGLLDDHGYGFHHDWPAFRTWAFLSYEGRRAMATWGAR